MCERASAMVFCIPGMWKIHRENFEQSRISLEKKMMALYSLLLPHITWKSSTVSIESM